MTSRTPAQNQTYRSVPAPWTCKCETYWLMLWLPRTLPADVYGTLEGSSLSDDRSSDARGGLGMVQIVRYSDTPVGAYDELLVMPGQFKVPGGKPKGQTALRISRIYVNSRETCFAGMLC